MGFCGDTFGKLVGQSRYSWMKSLGNRAILEGFGPRVQIVDPEAAEELLDRAIDGSKAQRRILFFCACEFPGHEGHGGCHRVTVARLVLEVARRRGIPIEVVEWPGGQSETFDVTVPAAQFSKLIHGGKSVPLEGDTPSSEHAGLPWGSAGRVQSDAGRCVVMSGPAKCSKSGWYLPVYDCTEDVDADAPQLKSKRQRWRSESGFEPRFTQAAN